MAKRATDQLLENLNALLSARGISQSDLARRARIPQKTINNILRGSSPRLDTLEAIAEGLGVPVSQLMSPGLKVDLSWGDYWRQVCAPKLKARKEKLGRSVPERAIATYVEANSGKSTKRGLVSAWLSGEREPYISQFFALCAKLNVDPLEILSRPDDRGR